MIRDQYISSVVKSVIVSERVLGSGTMVPPSSSEYFATLPRKISRKL